MIETSHIAFDASMLVGKPVIQGTRFSAELVIGLMADGCNDADILRNCPGVTHDDIVACLAHAGDLQHRLI
jgi:uncharacterized protein (DUF433 family)